ncbi:N,N-dimethylformamidase beta subunit family domain-containing protein [Kaistia adipata]|uniref:N,N-dimethylformamidase beta subunit family domain-containing protein n=1 Tax=Kaistia adipata TaxID=166954 RepID=UPI00040CD23D|nr:N,N-dimethylformamidase beta subunit family domain-containing protein [Kaistia adipata]
MELTGYSNRWTVRPGEEITFHIHCRSTRYEAQLVRLIHGDENPKGPGFKEQPIRSDLDGGHAGREQVIRKGSYGVVDLAGLLDGVESFTLSFWVCPTLPGPEDQGMLALHAPSVGAGLGLYLMPDGFVECRHGDAPALRSGQRLTVGEWYQLRLSVEVAARRLSLEIASRRWQPSHAEPDRVAAPLSSRFRPGNASLLFAAGWVETTEHGPTPHGVFNGKLARPCIVGPAPAGKEAPVLAAWDFSVAAGTASIVDVSGGGRHGRTENRPARTMTGPGWPGRADSTAPTPETHDAIHFHDDDVADVGWPESHRFRVPDDLASGVYALRLRTGGAEDHLPFFVAPSRSGLQAKLAVLMPTMSYLAYANESLDVSDTVQLAPRQDMAISPEAYAYVAANGLKSTYDLHRDGSGIQYGSRRRPVMDFRPKARCRTFDAPHQFAADLHLIDWLTVKGYDFDILTDDLLHEEGAALLAPYRAVVTGSHPEYWTARMLDGRDSWLDGGGRLAYLGGNGFYWVTGVAEDAPDVIEIRRYGGTRTSTGAIGEETLSVTHERGGLWRDRGRSPHSRVGIGFSGQGFDRGAPFRRSPRSFDPAWSWIFKGVEQEIVGAGPALVLGHGAAGFEVDRTDPRHGTPAHTVVLASTDRFTDAYQGAIEDFNSLNPWSGGSHKASGIRADIAYTPGPRGGAVFAAGSISWSSTLSQSGYDSDTSRITQNVLDAFLREMLPTS